MSSRAHDNPGEPEGMDPRRFVLVVSLVLITALIISAGIVLWQNHSQVSETKSSADVSMTQADMSAAAQNASLFIQTVGTFGVVPDAISDTGDSVFNVAAIIATDPTSDTSIFVPRSTAYMNARDYVLTNAPAYYDGTTVGQWTNSIETNYIMSVDMTTAKGVSHSKGAYITVDGKQTLSVTVDVTFSSQVTMRIQNGSDADWDGTYSVQSRGYSGQTVSVSMVKSGTGWKVYSLGNVKTPYLLASWKTPEESAVTLSGFQETKTIQTDLGIKQRSK